MTQFAKIKDSTLVVFPYTYQTLSQENPSTNFAGGSLIDLYAATDAASDGSAVVEVHEVEDPIGLDHTQKIVKNDTPTLKDGIWVLDKTVVSKTTEELAEDTEVESGKVRNKRNSALTATDWTQLADASELTKNAWKEYRQKLRDLPDQQGFPWNVEWPSYPTIPVGSPGYPNYSSRQEQVANT